MAKALEIQRLPPGLTIETVRLSKRKEYRIFKKAFGRNVGALLAGSAAPHKHSTIGVTYDTKKYSRREWREAPEDERKKITADKIDAVENALKEAGFEKGAENLARRLTDFADNWAPKLRGKKGVVLAKYKGVPVIISRAAWEATQLAKEEVKKDWTLVLEADTRDQLIQMALEKGLIADIRAVLSPAAEREWLPPTEIVVA